MDGHDGLQVTLVTGSEDNGRVVRKVLEAIKGIRSLAQAVSQGPLEIKIICREDDPWFTTGVKKRVILDRRMI
jgi:hypothetical protein